MTAKWEAPENGNPIAYNIYVNGNYYSSQDYPLTEWSNWVEGEKTYIEIEAVYENNMESVRIAKILSTEENIFDIEANNINIYPNPVNDILYIETQTQTLTQIEIYDVYGRLQDYKTTRLQGNVAIDVADL